MDQFLVKTRDSYPPVSFSNRERLLPVLEAFFRDGLAKVHIIADYDMTLTKQWITTPEGRVRNLSSHAVLERGPAVSEGFARHTKALADKYYPYEIDSTLDLPEKTRLMVDWWTGAHEAMIQEGITRSKIRDQAVFANMQFRAGLTDLFDTSMKHNIPFLIFSAGIANVIEELLAVNRLDRPNQTIVSNHMIFDESSGKLDGFSDPLIHTLNKGEHALHSGQAISEKLRQELVHRKNVILFGDSVGDAHMADGVQHDNVLKIGLFNFGDDQRRREFEQAFDVLLSGDTSLDWITDLLNSIAQ